MQILRVDFHRKCLPFAVVHHNVEQKGGNLPDDRGDGGADDAEGRESQETEDQNRVQDNVDDTAGGKQHHGDFHGAHGLKYFLHGKLKLAAEGDAHHDVGVLAGPGEGLLISGKEHEKRSGGQESEHHEYQAVDSGQSDADGGGAVGLLRAAGA